MKIDSVDTWTMNDKVMKNKDIPVSRHTPWLPFHLLTNANPTLPSHLHSRLEFWTWLRQSAINTGQIKKPQQLTKHTRVGGKIDLSVPAWSIHVNRLSMATAAQKSREELPFNLTRREDLSQPFHLASQGKVFVCKMCDRGYHMQCHRPHMMTNHPNWTCANCSEAVRREEEEAAIKREQQDEELPAENQTPPEPDTSEPTQSNEWVTWLLSVSDLDSCFRCDP